MTGGRAWPRHRTSCMPTSPGETTFAGTEDAPPGARIASDAPKSRKSAKSPPVRHRRPFGDMVLHAPQTLRALVRTNELWLSVLAAFIGCGAGILVWAMTE